MIDRLQLDSALAAASRCLADEPSFAWIKKSGLLERAYFAGLFGGLRGIASEADVGHILLRAMAGTMFSRSADDSFQSTQTGLLFDSVSRELLREDVDRPALLAAIQSLVKRVDELDGEWKWRVIQTRKLLEIVGQSGQVTEREGSHEAGDEEKDQQRYVNRRRLEELEVLVRFLALLELDHNLWERLQE